MYLRESFRKQSSIHLQTRSKYLTRIRKEKTSIKPRTRQDWCKLQAEKKKKQMGYTSRTIIDRSESRGMTGIWINGDEIGKHNDNNMGIKIWIWIWIWISMRTIRVVIAQEICTWDKNEMDRDIALHSRCRHRLRIVFINNWPLNMWPGRDVTGMDFMLKNLSATGRASRRQGSCRFLGLWLFCSGLRNSSLCASLFYRRRRWFPFAGL